MNSRQGKLEGVKIYPMVLTTGSVSGLQVDGPITGEYKPRGWGGGCF